MEFGAWDLGFPLAVMPPAWHTSYPPGWLPSASLVSKIAALYVQHFDDAVVLEAATEVEDLTTGLSQKIWQKIMIVQERDAGD